MQSRNIEEIHMAVLDITEYGLLVPAPDSSCPASLATYQLILNVYPGVTVYYSFMVFSTISANDLIVQHEKFHNYTLKLNTIIRHRQKNPITLSMYSS